jgi:hypothetical protein
LFQKALKKGVKTFILFLKEEKGKKVKIFLKKIHFLLDMGGVEWL